MDLQRKQNFVITFITVHDVYIILVCSCIILLYCKSMTLLQLFSMLQKNWNLFSVNIAMAGTGIYQLSRKLR